MTEQHHGAPPGERPRWLDEPKNIDRMFWILVGLCVFLVAIDVGLFFFSPRKAHWDWEKIPGFYGAFGFAAFWCIVLIGKHLRKLLKRDEDYYDP